MSILRTDHPLATGSLDYQEPYGVKENSSNTQFNTKLYELYKNNSLIILDIGCDGGGFVVQCVKDGHDAVGIDGSDFQLLTPDSNWNKYPNRFFTCDVSKPFYFDEYIFDVITSWETLEHLDEDGIDTLLETINKYVKQHSLFIGTIACHIDKSYHLTIEQPKWWFNKFNQHRWQYSQNLVDYFDTDWIRRLHKPAKIIDGIIKDNSSGFHFVCTKQT